MGTSGLGLSLSGLTLSSGKRGATGGGASVIQSIQQGTITIAAASASNTATISAVVTANSILIFNGITSTTTSSTLYHRATTRISLTNTTTVTATRINTSDSVTVGFTVIEFASGVNSVQQGTITITAGGTSNTGAVSAVGATAFVLYQGMATNDVSGISYAGYAASVTLTNSTTVTANIGAALTTDSIVGYMVVDLGSTIVSSVQQRTATNTGASSAWTDTISSVTVGQTLLFYNGVITTPKTALITSFANTLELTNSTTVTLTRAGTSTTSQTVSYVAVTFAAAALNGNIQRGTITLAAATSNTATITGVTTAKSAVIWGNERVTSNTPATDLARLDLTNTTTVTATVNTAGSPTVSYQVIQFN
jgi:hypothetical protein